MFKIVVRIELVELRNVMVDFFWSQFLDIVVLIHPVNPRVVMVDFKRDNFQSLVANLNAGIFNTHF